MGVGIGEGERGRRYKERNRGEEAEDMIHYWL